jgi:outer membrane cobalamin receptor
MLMLGGSSGFRKVRFATLAGAAAFVFLASPGSAQPAATTEFNIGKQSLGNALTQLGRQSHTEIIFSPSMVRGRSAGALRGLYSTEEAIARLLAGSGLRARRTANGAYVIESAPPGTALDAPPATDSEEAAAQAARVPDTIVVTGTKIPNAVPTSETIVVSKDDIQKNGYRSTDEILNALPQNFMGGVNIASTTLTGNPNGSYNFGNSSAANLRGLGPGSTLTLINGRRVAADSIEGTVDISAVPFPAILRVDIVPDGASAIYGADAVAGVVNFILGDRYRGLDTSGSYGFTKDGGARQIQIDQLAGVQLGNGNLVGAVEYLHQEPLLTTQRAYTRSIGPISLVPEIDRWTGYGSLQQNISSAFSIKAWAIGSRRKTAAIVSLPALALTQENDVSYDQWSGSLESRWKLSDSIESRLSFDYSNNDLEEHDDLTFGGAVFPSAQNIKNRLYTIDALISGSVLDTGQSRLSFVVGGGRRSERLIRNSGSESTTPVRNNSNVFGEILWSSRRSADRNAAGRIDLSASARWDHFSDFGTSTNYKVGARYFVLPAVSVRTSYGTAFRAPTLYQVHGARSVLAFDASRFGIAAAPGKTVLVRTGGNLDLGPETAKTFSFGADADVNTHLRASLTYFAVNYDHRIGLPFTNVTVAYGDPTVSAFVVRSPSVDEVLSTIGQATTYRDVSSNPPAKPEDVIAIFHSEYTNYSSTRAHGVDFELSSWADLRGVRIDAAIAGSVLDLDRRVLDSGPSTEITGTVYNPASVRLRGSLSAEFGLTRLGVIGHYTSGSRLASAGSQQPSEHVRSWFTLDMVASQRLQPASILDGVELSLKIANILNSKPPRIPFAINAYAIPYDSANANAFGRVVRLAIHREF